MEKGKTHGLRPFGFSGLTGFVSGTGADEPPHQDVSYLVNKCAFLRSYNINEYLLKHLNLDLTAGKCKMDKNQQAFRIANHLRRNGNLKV